MLPSRPFDTSPAARVARLACPLIAGVFCLVATARAQQTSPARTNDRAFLGLQTENHGEKGDGVKVVYVFPHSAAEGMGFQLGDRVIALNDVLIDDRVMFAREVGNNNIGGTLRFLVERSGKTLKIQGKIGSFRKTMTAYQDDLRGHFEGKPLPAPPATVWWNPKEKAWSESADLGSTTKDKLSVVFSIDDCRFCVEQKLPKLVRMEQILAKTSPDAPVAFVGYFFFDGKGIGEAKKAAEAVLVKHDIRLPFAVAYYPDDVERQRRNQALLHHHGVAILDREGNVTYLQIFGAPEREFFLAYQKGLAALQVGVSPAGDSSEDNQQRDGEGSGGDQRQ